MAMQYDDIISKMVSETMLCNYCTDGELFQICRISIYYKIPQILHSMLAIEISTKNTIDLLEGRIYPYQYFRNLPVKEFWESLSNGKTASFRFVDHEEYMFGYKTLSSLLLRYLQKKITHMELKFYWKLHPCYWTIGTMKTKYLKM